MDFEFKKNTLDGSYRVEFSSGHEAIGHWLIEEIGSDKSKIQSVLDVLRAQHDQMQTWQMQGEQWLIQIENNEVHIRALSLLEEGEDAANEDLLDEVEYVETQNFDPSDELDEYPDESESFCGIEDFEQVMLSWKEFV
ncbi:MAG: YacL family protein [Vibrio sp.]